MKILILASIFIFVGCSSASYNSKNYNDNPKAPVLHRSLLDADGFSEAAIQQILNSKVKIPNQPRLGIIRLTNSSQVESYNYPKSLASASTYDIDDAFVSGFFKTIQSSKNIKNVVPVPRSLVQSNPNFKQLRMSAVIVQADLLLVINSDSESNWDFNWSEVNRVAKGKTNLEAYLMDVRTGIVVMSGVYSDISEIKFESEKDYDVSDLMKRAKFESEKKVFNQVAQELVQFVEQKK